MRATNLALVFALFLAQDAASAPGAARRPALPAAAQVAGGTTIEGIEIRDARDAPARMLAPCDTFFVDVLVADTSGFRNVQNVEVALSLGSSPGVGMPSWQGARVSWQRGASPEWSVRTSKSAGWRLFPALSGVDTLTNATTPQRVRFALSPSAIARADTSGWQAQAWAGTVTAKVAGYGMAEHVEWSALDARGAFAAATVGTIGLPLSTPSTGRLTYRLRANTAVTLSGRVPAFTGVLLPLLRFGGGAGDTTVRWTSQSLTGTTSGYLDSLGATLGRTVDAAADTAATLVSLELKLALPPLALAPQLYRSSLTLDATSANGVLSRTLELESTILGSGTAASSATAEVEPHRVPAGAIDRAMLARLGFVVNLGETGINRVRVALPAGWSAPRVTAVSGALGLAVPFHDASTPGSAIAALEAKQNLGPLRVDFIATAPTLADSVGAGFATYFDDTTTIVSEQVATEGNPDLVGESGWYVVVEPAPAARVDVTPASAAVLVGDTVQVTAVVTDALGNVRAGDPLTWSQSGGAGSVGAGGRFLALAAGTSLVIASSGALADTARITVADPTASPQFSAQPVAPVRLLPGGEPVELALVLVRNPSLAADTVEAIELHDVSLGPVLERDRGGSWSAFELRDTTGARLASSLWAADRIRFENVGAALPAGASLRLRVFGAASVRARDGDSLGLSLASDADLVLHSRRPARLVNPAPAVRFAVDGMSAAQAALEPMAKGPVFAGARRRAIAQAHVPANGYAADRLLRLNVANRGTAEAGVDLERLEAWLDGGDHLLDTLADRRLGMLSFTGDRWELTGLSVDVPDSGACVLLSADVPTSARDGRTVRLALPALPDVALGMESGNSGPIDRELVSPQEDVIGGGERVLVTATRIAGGTVHAGQRNVPVLELVLANGYPEARHLQSLMLTNETTGAGTVAQLDADIAHLALDLAIPDPVGTGLAHAPLALGSFSNGRVVFDGLDLTLDPGAELRLSITADVDVAAAADGDRLAVGLASPQDVGFAEATMIGGAWPARSGAVWQVDGFVAAQATVRTVTGLTLAPGDGPVPALDVRLPGNGYLADVLHSVRVVNLDDADPAGIAELRLYRDGGDGRMGGAPSDDADLGPFIAIGGQWQSAYLSDPVPVSGGRYFVGLTVAGTTADSSLVRLAIPAGGVEMESNGDGPLDEPLANPEPHVLSTRPLLASLELDPASSTVGQQVDVRLTVRNAGTETFGGVAPGALVPEGTAAWQLVSGPAPPAADLAPGESATFTWTLTPASAGELRFATTASGTGQTSQLERRTLVARSGLGRVFMESDSLRLVALQSMPSAVNRGQAGVVPITLTLEHPGDASSSPILFRRVRVRLEQEDGSPIVPADLASAVEVREGTSVYLRRTALETSGGEIDLTLATPVTLRPEDPVSLSLRLDIAGATAVTTFRLVVPDSSVFVAEDAISGQPVRVRLQGQAYPVRSGLARILSGGGALVLSAPAPVVRRASSGQAAVAAATWQVTHSSSEAGSADLRLNAAWVRAGAPGGLASPLPWTRWRVIANGLVVNVHPVSQGDTGDVRLEFVPAPVVPPGGSIAVRFEADLAASSAGSRFALGGLRFAEWDVRDVNTGEQAPLVVNGPVEGDTILVEAPATVLDVAPLARMPATVSAGRSRLPVLDLVLRHPGPSGVAAIRIDSVRVTLHAPDGRRLVMDDYLGTLRLLRRGIALGAVVAPAASEATLPVSVPLAAATSDTLTLELDVAADAPAGAIGLGVEGGAIRACDANTDVAVSVLPEPPAAWPFESGSATLVAPARELRVSAASELPPLVSPSGAGPVPAARLVLRHPGPAGAGPIAVDHVRVNAADAAGAEIPIGSVAGALELSLGGGPIAQAAPAAGALDALLAFASPVEIAAGDSLVFALTLQPRAADPAARFRVGWRSDGIGVVQPASALLAVAVLAAPGASFPMWTDVAAFASGDLGASYANFPNPFAAGRDATTFAYLLPGPGRATLRIWTPRGEPVVTLLDSAPVPAGLRQSDRWDGRNGRGDVVANGVYVAELEVAFDDGHRQRVLRKVAVVR